ncbi:EamA family transporter [Microbacterium sp.]|uniref:EamA family transporter n=1 Tax=Microbacterium sp. TaxID=51671 RepID=UPI003A924796
MAGLPTGRAGAFTAVALVLVGELCMDAGAAIAVIVFPQTGPLGMVMLRLVFSALILVVVTRPRVRGYDREAWLTVIGYGLVLALMNGLFYQALRLLPLGVTVTIEVLGPLVLSVVASRRASAWVWAVIAFAGVVFLGGGGWDQINLLGVLFALGAAASWAFYILAAARAGRIFPRLDGLALAMSIGAVLSLPFGIVDAGSALLRPEVLGLGAAVAVLSSTIPYALELTALRRLPEAAFAILMSLSPATAALAGFVLLGQQLGVLQLAGMGLVIVAGIGAVRAGVADDGRRRGGMPRRDLDAVTGPLSEPTVRLADTTGPLATLNGPLTGPIEIVGPDEGPEEPFAAPRA